MFEFQSVRRSFPRNLAENSEAASFLGKNYIILDGSARTGTLGFLRMDYLQWKTQMHSEYFPRNVLAENINRWKKITADGLFRKHGTTTIWIWKHWNNFMVNNCSKRNSNWKIDMIEWLELKLKFQWKRNIQLASTSNY